MKEGGERDTHTHTHTDTHCPVAAQLSAISRHTGSDKWALTLLGSSLFPHAVTHIHCCHCCTNTHTLARTLCRLYKLVELQVRPAHTAVCFSYWTCTDPELHWPVSPLMKHTHTRSLFPSLSPVCSPVSPSLFLQQRLCACDKGFERLFSSWCPFFFLSWMERDTEREFKAVKSWKC